MTVNNSKTFVCTWVFQVELEQMRRRLREETGARSRAEERMLEVRTTVPYKVHQVTMKWPFNCTFCTGAKKLNKGAFCFDS